MSRAAPRARRSRGALAAALVGLGAVLQGCVGVAVQMRDTERLDPIQVARELREGHARHGGGGGAGSASAGLPRAPHGEKVVTRHDGGRTTYTYVRNSSSACWHLLVVVPVPTPGCDDKDIYVVEAGRLVGASRRRYPAHGVVCSPFLLPNGIPCLPFAGIRWW